MDSDRRTPTRTPACALACVCACACESYVYMNDAGEGGYCIVFANPTAYCTYKLEARHAIKKKDQNFNHTFGRAASRGALAPEPPRGTRSLEFLGAFVQFHGFWVVHRLFYCLSTQTLQFITLVTIVRLLTPKTSGWRTLQRLEDSCMG